MPIRATNPLGFKANVIRCATADIHMTPKDISKHWVDERQGATTTASCDLTQCCNMNLSIYNYGYLVTTLYGLRP